jgi:hypothetical protein
MHNWFTRLDRSNLSCATTLQTLQVRNKSPSANDINKQPLPGIAFAARHTEFKSDQLGVISLRGARYDPAPGETTLPPGSWCDRRRAQKPAP